MSNTTLEEVEAAHAEYDKCSEELAEALNTMKVGPSRSKEQLEVISGLTKRCDELMHKYLDAFKEYHS